MTSEELPDDLDLDRAYQRTVVRAEHLRRRQRAIGLGLVAVLPMVCVVVLAMGLLANDGDGGLQVATGNEPSRGQLSESTVVPGTTTGTSPDTSGPTLPPTTDSPTTTIQGLSSTSTAPTTTAPYTSVSTSVVDDPANGEPAGGGPSAGCPITAVPALTMAEQLSIYQANGYLDDERTRAVYTELAYQATEGYRLAQARGMCVVTVGVEGVSGIGWTLLEGTRRDGDEAFLRSLLRDSSIEVTVLQGSLVVAGG